MVDLRQVQLSSLVSSLIPSLGDVLLSCSVIFTTIHAQDFPDYDGDLAEGRRTLPILYPEGARLYMAAILVAWSAALTMLWNLGPVCSVIYIAAGSFIAWRFYTKRGYNKRGVRYDEKTLVSQIWLLCAVILPVNERFHILSF